MTSPHSCQVCAPPPGVPRRQGIHSWKLDFLAPWFKDLIWAIEKGGPYLAVLQGRSFFGQFLTIGCTFIRPTLFVSLFSFHEITKYIFIRYWSYLFQM